MLALLGRQTAHADSSHSVRLNELFDLLAMIACVGHAHILGLLGAVDAEVAVASVFKGVDDDKESWF
jgi:hypothetical protein